MNTIVVQTPAPVNVPRAAPVAAALFLRLLQWFQGQARAEARQQSDRQAEAQEVRQYALRFASHDPRFAADLLEAADRHERAA